MLESGVKALRGGVVCTFRWKLVGPMGGNMKGKNVGQVSIPALSAAMESRPYVSIVLASERQKT